MAQIIDYDLLGKNIKRLCKEKGITQQKLEKKCGYPPSTISVYTTGKRSPSFYRLRELAYGLDVEVSELLKPEGAISTDIRIIELFNGMSRSMQEAIIKIMEVSQEDK